MSEIDSIIQLNHLHFYYEKRSPILKNLNLKVSRGSIYGFLGANGAGKSTTIRILLGLMKAQSGNISLFGKPVTKHDPKLCRQIGTLVEAPSIYPHLNASKNLKIVCQHHDISHKSIESTLDYVGLLSAKNKKVKHYSMGMKQRLGLAMAIIHNPDLLVLDEPTNGLDPNGISEIRNLILDLKNQGKTLLLSSHLLSEIEKIATHVGIIENGRLIFEGTISDLEKLKSSHPLVRVNTRQTRKSREILSNHTIEDCVAEEYLEVRLNSREELSAMITLLVSKGIELGEIQFQKTDLESLFIELTNHD